MDAATELDVLQARAQFSIAVDGVQPALATDGRLELRAARHPLLIPGGAASYQRRASDETAAVAGSARRCRSTWS